MTGRPYYGITGLMTVEQTRGVIAMINELGMPQDWQLMAGVLTSWRGLSRGELADQKHYLLPRDIEKPMVEDARVINLIHYNSRAGGLFAQLEALLGRAIYCDGVQLNVAWPNRAALCRWRQRSYGRVVLQVGRRAYAEVGHDPRRLAERLMSYADCITDVLLDLSGGTGVSIDTEMARTTIEWLKTLASGEPPFGLGAAGGLTGENVYEVMGPLLELHPTLSFDAQSGLYARRGDGVSLKRCRRYLEEVARLLRG